MSLWNKTCEWGISFLKYCQRCRTEYQVNGSVQDNCNWEQHYLHLS